MSSSIGRLLPLLLVGCGAFAPWPCAEEWVPAAAPSVARELTPREPCLHHEPTRQPLFGDLHVHTAYSFDARSRDMLSTPDDAYRFARGESIGLGPFDAERRGTRTAQLERPLDFAAVTDHAEWIGEVTQCTTPSSPAYETNSCSSFRGETEVDSVLTLLMGPSRMLGLIGLFDRASEVCGPDSRWCRDGLGDAWRDTQAATERWYDRSAACTFTSLHGWEHSYSPGTSKVHRNVIFRNEIVPELPISSLEQPDALGLWERLEEQCDTATTGCDVVTIPHNPNVSNGRLFTLPYRGESLDEQKRQAALRARMEPLVEMMQIKGESECANGMFGVIGDDEFCDFEKARAGAPERPDDCGEGVGTGALRGRGCQSRLDFVRYAVTEGLREEQRIGINPLQLGFIGSTDSHNATPGDVEEYSYPGCCSNVDTTPAARLLPDKSFAGRPAAVRNPGGLMGVWAEENNRNSIFDAIERRETFATSGPRITPRFFGGWDYPEDLCASDNLAERGYAQGVAMGAALPDASAAAPTFVASALRDAGVQAHPGGLLQRIQIVKVWVDDEAQFRQDVYDVAGDSEHRAEVDLSNCEPSGPGHDELCAVWHDPDFDPSRNAAYYARVIENPSCRWSWWECIRLPESERPAECTEPSFPRIIQERAWTSPIWYTVRD